MADTKIKMGQMPKSWGGDLGARSITFCVTEDCNLACKYCYMTHKNSKTKMSFETAKKAVDYILNDRETFNNGGVIWEFIGGEPFLEIELIDKICDYIKYRMYILDHPWFEHYRFNFSSNGLLYNTKAVQNYIKKNYGHLSIGLSVDGNKIKHDLQRIKPNGNGSYDEVLKNVPLWLEQFPTAGTKATFAHDDLPYLKDSIISLWENGIDMVAANVVFEDVWEDGDDILFENQLKELADYILENELWDKYSVRFFSPTIGFPLSKDSLKTNFCGAGKMLAIDCSGNLFPCIRFYDISLSNRKGYKIGDIHSGINQDRLRPFEALTTIVQSKEECIKCEIASGCAWCTGFNYDSANTPTIYQRATFNCKMHKANVRACEYFWDKFSRVTGHISEREKHRIEKQSMNSTQKNLLFITSDSITPHCSYRNKSESINTMDRETIEKGLKFAENNGFIPVMLGKPHNALYKETRGYVHLVGSDCGCIPEEPIIIYDNNKDMNSVYVSNAILLLNKSNIEKLVDFADSLFKHTRRINLVLEDIEEWNNSILETYEQQLYKLVNIIKGEYEKKNIVEFSVLTDISDLKSMCNCEAGNTTFALAPNGKIYMCPAFYFDDRESFVGDLENGIKIVNEHFLSLENSPICTECDAFHCKRCKFLNQKLTSEIHIPGKMQCLISHVERNASLELQRLLEKEGCYTQFNRLSKIEYLDPLEKFKKSC